MLTVGEILKKEREKRGITLKEIERKSRIREKFLNALENNDWNFFTSKIYIEGIIKNYGRYLDLDVHKLLAFFRRDYERLEEVKFKEKVSSSYIKPQRRQLVFFGIGLVFIFFFLYFGYQFASYLTPPRVTILSPKATSFGNDERVKVVGKTQKEATINIFGERVFQNKEGVFEYSFPLKKGKNELVIEVIGANGRKTIIRRTYLRTK